MIKAVKKDPIQEYTALFRKLSKQNVNIYVNGSVITDKGDLLDTVDYSDEMKVTVSYNSKGPATGFYWGSNYITCIVSFTLIEQKNCCGICLMTHFSTRELKYGPAAHELALYIAKIMKFTMVMCTDVGRTHRIILKKSGWTEDCAFKNKRPGHGSIIYVAHKMV